MKTAARNQIFISSSKKASFNARQEWTTVTRVCSTATQLAAHPEWLLPGATKIWRTLVDLRSQLFIHQTIDDPRSLARPCHPCRLFYQWTILPVVLRIQPSMVSLSPLMALILPTVPLSVPILPLRFDHFTITFSIKTLGSATSSHNQQPLPAKSSSSSPKLRPKAARYEQTPTLQPAHGLQLSVNEWIEWFHFHSSPKTRPAKCQDASEAEQHGRQNEQSCFMPRAASSVSFIISTWTDLNLTKCKVARPFNAINYPRRINSFGGRARKPVTMI